MDREALSATVCLPVVHSGTCCTEDAVISSLLLTGIFPLINKSSYFLIGNMYVNKVTVDKYTLTRYFVCSYP